MHYLSTSQGHGLGWLADRPDPRDHIFRPEKVLPPIKLPRQIDLRAQCPPVYNQGQLGSCTANALAAAFDFDRQKENKPFMTPSRLFIYWNERDIEGTVNSDAGAYIRDGVKSLCKIGAAPEQDWPYDITKFTIKPPEKAYADAEKNLALTYQRILRPEGDPSHDMLTCLSSGYPFVAGFLVYASFESQPAASTGMIPVPKKGETLLGGHAILVVGYELDKQYFICRNSWSTDWGDNGYFYMPFAYFENARLSSDMWLVRTVEV